MVRALLVLLSVFTSALAHAQTQENIEKITYNCSQIVNRHGGFNVACLDSRFTESQNRFARAVMARQDEEKFKAYFFVSLHPQFGDIAVGVGFISDGPCRNEADFFTNKPMPERVNIAPDCSFDTR